MLLKKYKELHRKRRKGKSHANAARIEKSPYKIVNSTKTPRGKENNEMQYLVKEDHFLAAGCAGVGEASRVVYLLYSRRIFLRVLQVAATTTHPKTQANHG